VAEPADQEREPDMDENKDGRPYWLLGLAVLGGLLLAGSLFYQHGRAGDPVARANDLIARCNHKIAEIESSLEHLQATIQPAA
jgi:MYXO-CTERM domain-containing protein